MDTLNDTTLPVGRFVSRSIPAYMATKTNLIRVSKRGASSCGTCWAACVSCVALPSAWAGQRCSVSHGAQARSAAPPGRAHARRAEADVVGLPSRGTRVADSVCTPLVLWPPPLRLLHADPAHLGVAAGPLLLLLLPPAHWPRHGARAQVPGQVSGASEARRPSSGSAKAAGSKAPGRAQRRAQREFASEPRRCCCACAPSQRERSRVQRHARRHVGRHPRAAVAHPPGAWAHWAALPAVLAPWTPAAAPPHRGCAVRLSVRAAT